MEEQIDVDFNPTEYLIPKGYFIDRTFWEHIDENMDVPSKSEMKFYVPTIRARKGWMEKLKQVYNLEPQTVYESSIVNLPEEITAEEI